MKRLRSTSAKRVVLPPVFPNAGVQAWYQLQMDARINQAASALLKDIAVAWAKTPPIFHGSHITAAYGDSALAMDSNAAGVIFRCRDKILLLCRTDGLGWGFPGGGVEEGETFEDAARREVREEMGVVYAGSLTLEVMQQWRDVSFATYGADVPGIFKPELNAEHNTYRWVTIEEALKLALHPGVRATLEDMTVAMDAPSPTKALQAALKKWGSQTIKRFDLTAQTIADNFAARNAQATQASVMAQLKTAGFTVKFKPTMQSMEAFRVTAAENVGLIRSIPRKFHAEVEAKVWNAVRNGSDLHKLSTELRKSHKSTLKRAALIARDQNAKAKATIERVRQMELGITRGIWMHSSAGKEPRENHLAWGREQRTYDLAKGMWDDVEGEWIHPGELINCRCTMRPIIEGFED